MVDYHLVECPALVDHHRLFLFSYSHFKYERQKIQVLKAEVVENVDCESRNFEKVIFVNDGRPTVICGNGLLRITEAYYFDDEGESYLPMKSFRIKGV